MKTHEILNKYAVPAMVTGQYHLGQGGRAGPLDSENVGPGEIAPRRDLKLASRAFEQGKFLASEIYLISYDNGNGILYRSRCYIAELGDAVIAHLEVLAQETDGHRDYDYIGAWLIEDNWQLGLAIWLHFHSDAKLLERILAALKIRDPLRARSQLEW